LDWTEINVGVRYLIRAKRNISPEEMNRFSEQLNKAFPIDAKIMVLSNDFEIIKLNAGDEIAVEVVG
jgi:hypothetical protein